MWLQQRFSWLVIVFSMGLVACTSNKIVKTYPGDIQDKNSIAVLSAPENITILSVNGKDMQQYLLSNLNVNYGLKVGENLVVFKYESIWSRAKKDEVTGSRVDVVESEPLEVLIQAEAGEHYSFSFMPATNVREAKSLVNDFSAQVLDENKNLVAESAALGTYQQAMQDKEKAKQAEILESQTLQASSSDPGQSVLDKLKQIWPTASSDEKKAFLVWVFQK
ncbi:MAG: DUF2057 family protein [Oleiphilus sp.]